MEREILNMTQHPASEEQVKEGVVDLNGEDKSYLQGLLTFNNLPSSEDIADRVMDLVNLVTDLGYEEAMIGGAPYLMPKLAQELVRNGVEPLFAFSQRVSVEEVMPDGSVVKKAVFKHLGFVRIADHIMNPRYDDTAYSFISDNHPPVEYTDEDLSEMVEYYSEVFTVDDVEDDEKVSMLPDFIYVDGVDYELKREGDYSDGRGGFYYRLYYIKSNPNIHKKRVRNVNY